MRLRSLLVLFAGLVLGALVFSPALRTPVFMDDYLHRAMIDGTYLGHRGPFDLYDLFTHAERPAAMDHGALAWWTDPKFTVRFLRPLSSALLWADARALGGSALLAHLHSLAWWAVAVLGARALYRRLLSKRAAGFAAFAFAMAPCHTAPLGWLANREELVALALGVWALFFYVRARDGGRARDRLASFALFAAAMLAGEYALCAGGYVVAIELARPKERVTRRATGLASFVVPAAAYLAARVTLGYGATGSGFYRDPTSQPLLFLQAAPRRFATLLLDGWMDVDADGFCAVTPWYWLVLIFAGGTAIVYAATRRALSEASSLERRATAWLLGGAILSLVPVLAVSASIRLIGASMIGVAGVVGVIVDRVFYGAQAASTPSRRAELAGLAALVLGFVHFVRAPVTAYVDAESTRLRAIDFAKRMDETKDAVPDPAHDTVIFLRATWETTLFGPFAEDPRGKPPSRWRVLTQTLGHVLVLRDGPRTVELVVPKDQSLFPFGPDDLFRSEDHALRSGDVIDVPGMRVTVVDADARGTHRVKYELDRPVTDPSLVWLVENHDGVTEATLPEIGFGKPFDP